MPHRQPIETIFGPPLTRWQRGRSHLAWALRHPVKAVVVGLAGIPGVRRHVLSTTPIKDHPLYAPIDRAHRRTVETLKAEARGIDLTMDHPAGCFYGSFANAYPDIWHIPWNADCPFDHGEDATRLLPPRDAPEYPEVKTGRRPR